MNIPFQNCRHNLQFPTMKVGFEIQKAQTQSKTKQNKKNKRNKSLTTDYITTTLISQKKRNCIIISV